MSKVWDKVVEDLNNYQSAQPKTFWQKVKDWFVTKCNDNCDQGRKCDCCGG